MPLAVRLDGQPSGYEQYLQSKDWAKIKRRVLKRDGRVCKLCGGHGTIVHHRSYELDVMDGKADHRLATVCEGCHDYIHFADDGSKRPPGEWESLLLAGRHDTAVPEPMVDLRLKSPARPEGWSRMSTKQRERWTWLRNIRFCEKHIAKGHENYKHELEALLKCEPGLNPSAR